jgi:hypothetical protein
MGKQSVSYTLRISNELKGLLEVAAVEEEVSLASLMIRACWQFLEMRGGGLERRPMLSTTGQTPTLPPLGKMNPAMEKAIRGMTSQQEVLVETKEECGFQAWNDVQGEMMACGRGKHSAKSPHGQWRLL